MAKTRVCVKHRRANCSTCLSSARGASYSVDDSYLFMDSSSDYDSSSSSCDTSSSSGDSSSSSCD